MEQGGLQEKQAGINPTLRTEGTELPEALPEYDERFFYSKNQNT